MRPTWIYTHGISSEAVVYTPLSLTGRSSISPAAAKVCCCCCCWGCFWYCKPDKRVAMPRCQSTYVGHRYQRHSLVPQCDRPTNGGQFRLAAGDSAACGWYSSWASCCVFHRLRINTLSTRKPTDETSLSGNYLVRQHTPERQRITMLI